MVFVTGDPGIGKTALVEALLREVASGGALIARGTCIEQYGSGEAYLPVLGALGPISRPTRCPRRRSSRTPCADLAHTDVGRRGG
jgi:predicted ATPase